MSKTITAYKGFDSDLSCRGFQFEVGETYTHDGPVRACNSGFHVCEHPLDIWRYYPPGTSRFALVEVGGNTDGHSEDSKLAVEKLTIKSEVSLAEFIKLSVEAVIARAKKTKKASNSGYQGAASNSGYQGAASNSGYQGAASNSGDYGAASNSGTRGAASNSGYQGAASNSGYQGAAFSHAPGGKVMAEGDGQALYCTEFAREGSIKSVAKGITGKGNVKAGTWYTARNGKLVKADA